MKFIKENFEIDKLAYSFASTQNNPWLHIKKL